MKQAVLIVFFLALISGLIFFNTWRVNEFAKSTGMGFWKAYFVLGK